MPLPTAAELTDPSATNIQMKQMLGQLAESVQDKSKTALSYLSLSEANADIANIPLGVSVKVLSAENGGEYYKSTSGATSLTKSPNDPTTLAQSYTDSSVRTATSDSNLIHRNQVKNADFTDGINGVIVPTGAFNAVYAQIPNYTVIRSSLAEWASEIKLIDDYWVFGGSKSLQVLINKTTATPQDVQLFNVIEIPTNLVGKSSIDVTVCIPYLNGSSDIQIFGLAKKSVTGTDFASQPAVTTDMAYATTVGSEETLVFKFKVTDPSTKYVAVGFRCSASGANVTGTVKVGGFAVYFNRPNVGRFEPSVYKQDAELAKTVEREFPQLSNPLTTENEFVNAALVSSTAGSAGAPSGWSLASGGAGTVAGDSKITNSDPTLPVNVDHKIFSVSHYNNGTVRTDRQLTQNVRVPAHLIGSGKTVRVIQWCKRSSEKVDFSLVARWKDGSTQLTQFAPTSIINQPTSGQWALMIWETKLDHATANHLELLFRTQVNASSGVVSDITTQQTLFGVFFDTKSAANYARNFEYDVEQIAKEAANNLLNQYIPPSPHDNDFYTNSLGDLEKVTPSKTLINMGDSQFNALYSSLVSVFTDRTVINGGVGGERTDHILSRLDGVANHTNTSGWVSGQTVKLKAGLVPVSREADVSYRSTWAEWLKFRAVPQKISFMRNGVWLATAYSADRRKVTATVSGATFTAANHGFEMWDRITPNSANLPNGMVKDKVYWVRDVTENSFSLAENYQGGNAVTWTAFAGSIDFLSEYEVSWIYDGGDKNITAIVNSSWDYSTMLIGGGTNDIVQGKAFTEITANIRACVNHGKTLHKRVIVSGIPGFYESGSDAAWKIGGAKYNLMIQVNNWIKREYPHNHVDPYAMLLNSGDGSANDNADIAVGLVPRSLRVATTDGHINETGNLLRANQIKTLMIALKW